jgi:NADPH-dependent 2,4-dienoyl-CoA reductase/sulfur reductase-like enzyme
MKQQVFDVLVIGAGPAGIAAALSAAQGGIRAGLVDDNPRPGGQIWRGGLPATQAPQGRQWLARLAAGRVTVLPSTRVVAPLDDRVLLAERAQDTLVLRGHRLILATGARELFLPFPGWTLLGVMGAGGLQALVKGGLPIAGKRVVVAGSGPLLPAVAAYLRHKGARVLLMAEQASWPRLARFAMQLAVHPAKLRQGAGFGRHLRGTPFRTGCWVTQAHGQARLEAVTVRQGDWTRTLACDYLACGFGLVPNTELPAALGCALEHGAVWVDRSQQTSVAGVYCAGEATGVGGVDLALAEGRMAGYSAAGRPEIAQRYVAARARARRFAATLEQTFALRDDLRTLAQPDTLVCRCEDVPYGLLREHVGWQSAKLHTRCGMGPCQGRVCGAVTAHLFGWTQDSVRPPIAPARLESLALTTDDGRWTTDDEP